MENHYLTVDNREKITISQVADVDAFDEETLWANLQEGAIEISGENLNIESLDLSLGTLIVSGKINAIIYTDKKSRDSRGLVKNFMGRRKR